MRAQEFQDSGRGLSSERQNTKEYKQNKKGDMNSKEDLKMS